MWLGPQLFLLEEIFPSPAPPGPDHLALGGFLERGARDTEPSRGRILPQQSNNEIFLL